MKKLLLGTAMSLAMVGGASAADLAVYNKAPVWSWTGCYVGGNVGGGWSHADVSFTDGTPVATLNGNGIVGGGQVGCDYQFAGGWVIGVAGEFEAANIKGSSGPTLTAPTQQIDSNIPWIATATARLGYAVTPATLLYARGGAAWMRDNADVAVITPFTIAATGSENRSGWTVGGGIEHKFWSNMSGFVEYNYLGFGTRNLTFTGVGAFAGQTVTVAAKENIQEVLVGLNFRFGGH
jgi:outer membrane immunogenic protein